MKHKEKRKELEKRTEIRKTAVKVHHDGAGWFKNQYSKSSNQYSTPFLYGRKKIDKYFRNEIRKLKKNAKILDVGCGTGDQILELHQQGFNVIGIEPAVNMRKHAEKKLPKGIVRDGSILKLPFPDNTFDFVYALEVFRYLDSEDNIQGLKEIYRVLKPNGVFFATFVNRNALDGFYILTHMRRLNERIFGEKMLCHTEFETPKALSLKVRAVGFSKVVAHGAMLAWLRIIYAISRPLGEYSAKKLESFDDRVSDSDMCRALSGHLLIVAKK
jgi:ubiquinone/menaquinone biosynthesis C-methylase UbiE